MPQVALSRKFKKKLLLWGIGDLAANELTPVETKDVDISFEGDTIEQEKDGESWGANKKFRTTDKVKITGKVAFAASGTAGTAPAYRDLFLMAGHSETVSEEGSTVTYTPETTDTNHGTVAFLLDGQFHIGKKAQAEVKLSANSGELGYWEFEISMVGGTVPIEKPSDLNTIVEGYKTPKAVNFANTPVFKLGNKDYAMKSFSHTTGNEVTSLDMVNHQSSMISDRKPVVSITVGAPQLSEINLYQKAWDGEEMPLVLEHGTTAGQKIKLDYPAVALDIPKATDMDGALGYEIECSVMQSASKPPYTIVFS
ncbi:hypothetical protein A6J60_011725 [Psychrobacter sp. FDAARGOS_221]|nr:hypothetical protein A6J60_000220 [Psychrobacter sp. FDAARGOS_221]PNK59919.1 hypothetical protein A6J60_002840 [Psychrobacter sp. FDAARGOS_221]PNK61466.1 hypothetical protein A6J60_011725 [Psychrobacter sp. FDAARGOS_221]